MNKITPKTVVPLVSIITPCFNQGHFLADLLGSVQFSCRFPHEVIIVNDGSTDPRTEQCLKKIQPACNYQHIHIISVKNKGLPAARNTGLKVAKGRYIQFLDADDLLTANKIDLQIKALEANKDIAVHLTEYVLCDITRTKFWYPPESTIDGFLFTQDSFLEHWERGLTIPIHCALFRHERMKDIWFNESLKGKEDWVFWVNIARNHLAFEYCSFVGAVYRSHSTSMCKDYQNMAMFWLKAIQHFLEEGIQPNNKAKATMTKHYNEYYLRHLAAFPSKNVDPSIATQKVIQNLLSLKD